VSTISVRLPKSLHEKARELAQKERVSLNQLITLALAEKMSAILTDEYLGERAKKANKRKFRRAMAKVPDQEPEEYDRL
jgi:hypothetical protein